MKLNKMIPLFLAVVMIFSAIPTGVSAEGGVASTPSYLRVNATEISAASDGVLITLDASEEVLGGEFILSYDSAILDAFGYEEHAAAYFVVDTDYAKGKVKVSFASAQAIANGQLISIRFETKIESSAMTQITLEQMQLYNADGTAVDTEGKNAVCSVKKIVGPQGISFSKTDLILGSGDTYQLNPILTPSDAVVDSWHWWSSDSSVVAVDENGLLTAYGTGTAQIECRANSVLTGNQWASCTVTVYTKPSITVMSAEASVGAVLTLPVRMESSGNSFTSGSINFQYDPAYMRLISCTAGELLQSTMVTINGAYREDMVRMNFAGQLPLAGTGTLCTLTFEVLQEGETEVTPTNVALYAEKEESYRSLLKSGVVTVSNGTLSLTDYSGNVGVGFIMKLSYSGEMPVAGGSVLLKYDPTKLTVGAITSLDPSLLVYVNENYGDGYIKLSIAGTVNKMTLDAVTISFAAKTNDSMMSVVEILSADLYDENAKQISPACKNGRVILSDSSVEFSNGDLDGNGALTTWDAVLLAKLLAGNTPSTVVFEAGDVNGDGWIDDADMIALMERLLASKA